MPRYKRAQTVGRVLECCRQRRRSMCGCRSVLLLSILVCLASARASVGVSVNFVAVAPPASAGGHVNTRLSETQPFLQGIGSSEKGRFHSGKRKPNPSGMAGEVRTRRVSTTRRQRTPGRNSVKARVLWGVPLTAVTVLLVFSALRRRCASLAETAPLSSRGGASIRRLARRGSYLAAVCSDRTTEGESPQDVVLEILTARDPGEVWIPRVDTHSASPLLDGSESAAAEPKAGVASSQSQKTDSGGSPKPLCPDLLIKSIVCIVFYALLIAGAIFGTETRGSTGNATLADKKSTSDLITAPAPSISENLTARTAAGSSTGGPSSFSGTTQPSTAGDFPSFSHRTDNTLADGNTTPRWTAGGETGGNSTSE